MITFAKANPFLLTSIRLCQIKANHTTNRISHFPLLKKTAHYIGPNIDKALELHKQAEKLSRDMEKAYKSRDKKIPAIKDILRRSRDILKGVYGGNVKDLGDFGFTVDTTPKRKKKQC